MGLTVFWTRFAENKLDDIFDYYESRVSTRTARRLINGIIDKTIGIEENPFMGQKENLLSDYPQDFRYLIFKSYKIIYWINQDKNRIDIVNVFDTRQNPLKMKNIE